MGSEGPNGGLTSWRSLGIRVPCAVEELHHPRVLGAAGLGGTSVVVAADDSADRRAIGAYRRAASSPEDANDQSVMPPPQSARAALPAFGMGLFSLIPEQQGEPVPAPVPAAPKPEVLHPTPLIFEPPHQVAHFACPPF